MSILDARETVLVKWGVPTVELLFFFSYVSSCFVTDTFILLNLLWILVEGLETSTLYYVCCDESYWLRQFFRLWWPFWFKKTLLTKNRINQSCWYVPKKKKYVINLICTTHFNNSFCVNNSSKRFIDLKLLFKIRKFLSRTLNFLERYN